MTKTVSARDSEKVHQKIINRCDTQGCPVKEFLNAAIEFSLLDNVYMELGDSEGERLGTIVLTAFDWEKRMFNKSIFLK